MKCVLIKNKKRDRSSFIPISSLIILYLLIALLNFSFVILILFDRNPGSYNWDIDTKKIKQMTQIDKAVKSNVTQAIKDLNRCTKARSSNLKYKINIVQEMILQYEEYFGVSHPKQKYYATLTTLDLLL